MPDDSPTLSPDRDQGHRRAVYAAIVEARAGGAPPGRVRMDVARRFGLTTFQVKVIESEGDQTGRLPRD